MSAVDTRDVAPRQVLLPQDAGDREQLVAHHDVVAGVEVGEQRRRRRRPCPTPRRRSPRRPRATRPSPRAPGSSGCRSASRSTRSGPTRAPGRPRPPSRRRCRRRTWRSRRSACCARAWWGRAARPRGSPAWRSPRRPSVRASAVLLVCRCPGARLRRQSRVAGGRARAGRPAPYACRAWTDPTGGPTLDPIGRRRRSPRPGSRSGCPGSRATPSTAGRRSWTSGSGPTAGGSPTSCAAASSAVRRRHPRVRGGLPAVPARSAGPRAVPRGRPAATSTTTGSRTSTTTDYRPAAHGPEPLPGHLRAARDRRAGGRPRLARRHRHGRRRGGPGRPGHGRRAPRAAGPRVPGRLAAPDPRARPRPATCSTRPSSRSTTRR